MRWKIWAAVLAYSIALAYVFYDLGQRRVLCSIIMTNLDQTGVHLVSNTVK